MYKLLKFDTVDSTNLEAKRLTKTLTQDNYVIWAYNQTAGRGRVGKSWESLIGNLFTSILFSHSYCMENITQFPIIVGVSIIEALEKLRVKNLSLKWPNDVLLNKKKLAGILVEHVVQNEVSYLITGIGINVKTSSRKLDQPVTSLHEEGYLINLQELLNIVIESFYDYKKQWEEHGFSKIRLAWINKANKIGESIKLNYNGKQVKGLFQGIDNRGALLLESNDGKLSSYMSSE